MAEENKVERITKNKSLKERIELSIDYIDSKDKGGKLITFYDIALKCKVTEPELKEELQKEENKELSSRLNNSLNNNLFHYGFISKIPTIINTYVENKVSVKSENEELKVLVDINSYQQKLQPFSKNVESAGDIVNEDDEVVVIDKVTEKELEEMGLEVIDA